MGQLGPEEQMVYATVVSGYFVGGLGAAKTVTKYQEHKEKDLKYTRPFITPFDGLSKVKSFLEDEKDVVFDVDLEVIFEEE